MRKITLFFLAFIGLLFTYQTSLAQYCTSGATTSYDTSIDGVTLNGNSVNINNSTIGVCDQYSDFTSLPAADLSPGQSYTVTIAMGSCSAYNYNKGSHVFIDWNADFDFTDSGESVGYTATTGSAAGTLSVTFTVPITASVGTTRMRVVCQETSSPANILSCGGFSYGSTEDYSISIQSLYACDLGAMSWDYPAMSSNDLTATEAVMITVVNVGTAAQSNFTVWYSLDNGVTQTTELVTTSVPSGVTYQHTFAANANFSTPGTFDCEFGVTLACDSNALNDSQALQVVNATSVSTFPYFQNFEAANFWQAGGAGSWAEGTPSANVINAAYSGTTSWATNLTGNHSANEYSWVESPFFNLSTLTAPVVEFKMWYEIHTAYADGVCLQYTTDGGATWQHVGIGLGALTGDPNGDNWYNTMSIEGLLFYNGWAGSTSGYQTMKYFLYGTNAITNLAGAQSVKFRMLFGSNASTQYNGVAFDDFMVYQNPDNDLRAMSITSDPACIGATGLSNMYLEVKNEGALAQSAFNVSYSTDGGATYVTESVTQTMAAGDLYLHTFATQFDMTVAGTYNVIGAVTLVGDQNNFNDTAYNSFTTLAGFADDDLETWSPNQTTNSCTVGTSGASGPADGWYQDPSDAGEWRLDVGGTGSSGTGPTTDYNPGTSSGHYLYTETSGCYGATVSLLTPCLDFSGSAFKLEFAYHMLGAAMGSLSVDVWDGSAWVNDVWTVFGDQGASWHVATVGLGAFTNPDAIIRIRSVTGTSYTSDCSIDDIKMIELLPDDIAVNALYPLSFCPDTVDVYAVVENVGNNAITSVNVNWSIDGTAMPTIAYTNTLATGQIDSVLLGAHYFASGSAYDFVVWTDSPNLGTDPNPLNDTLVFNGFQASLSGTYSIGATGSFVDFVAAVAALNNFGVCGPVVFEADSGTYDGQITLGDITGADSTNTITFTSATGDSTDVVVQYGASGTSDNWVWQLTQDYVTISHITIQSTATGSYGRVVHLHGTNYSTITNCVINSVFVSSSLAACFYNYNDQSDNYNTISYNSINNGYYGFYMYSNSGTNETHNMIIGNVIKDFYYYGIYGYYQNSWKVKDNYVEQSSAGSTTLYGIYNYYCHGAVEITGNQIVDMAGSTCYPLRVYYSNGDATTPGLVANNMISVSGTTGTVYGLYHYNSSNWKIFHNSVNITSGSSSATSNHAFYFYGSSCTYSNVQFKNNNAVNAAGGYAILINDDMFLCPIFFSNNNNLWTSGANVARLESTNIPTIADWQLYYPLDVVSDPGGFAGTHDLHTNAILLNDAGAPLADVTTDFDGEMRDATTPDIGADEFTPVDEDAGVIAILGLGGVCPGSADVSATINNFGLVDLWSVTVNWSVNGVAQTPVVVTDTIAVGATYNVLLGSYVFASGVSYDVSSWTTLPNGIGDGNTTNDQFDVLGMGTAIAGNYTIGATGDFATIVDAADFLTMNGVCGPAVFDIQPGTYSGQVTLGNINGNDSTNYIVFQSLTGVASDVVVEYGATSDANNWVWGFHGVDWCTVQNITIKSVAAGNYGRVVTFHYGSNHNSLLNNNIQSVYVTSSYAAGIRSYNDSKDEYNLISGNTITGGYYGMYWYASSANFEMGNQFLNNNVLDYYYYGLYTYYQYGVKINGNYIEQLSNGSAYQYPLYAYYADGYIEVMNNHICDNSGSSMYGMRVYYCDNLTTTPSLVANNMISASNMTSTCYGLYVYNTLNVNIYHNSVYLQSNGTCYTGYVYMSSSSYGPYNVMNNSFVHDGTAGYCLYGSSSGLANYYSSNNNLYTGGANLCYFSGYYPTLTDWQSLYPGDVVNTDGSYYGGCDLHSLSPQLDGGGTPLVEVPMDIDGEVRNLTAPDIGADEFTLPNNDLTTLLIYHYGEVPIEGGADQVKAIVRNIGLLDQVNVPITLDITGANTFTTTVVWPVIVAGDVDTIIFDPFTPTMTGLNNIMVSVPNDENNANNSVSGYNMATQDLFAYADSTGSVGNGGVQNGRIYMTRYYMGALKQVTEIQTFITDDPDNAGNAVYGVVLDANGMILAQGDTVVLDTAHYNTWLSLPITVPSLTSMANVHFYAGFAQTPKIPGGDYHPVGFQDENPMRWDAYFYSALDGSAFTPFTNNRRWMIKAKVDDPAPWDAATLGVIAPMGGCGLGLETVTVQVQNNGSDTITALDLSYWVTGAAAAVTESVTTYMLPGDILDYDFTTQYDFSVTLADSTFGITSWATLIGDAINYNDTAYNEVEAMFVPADPVPQAPPAVVLFGTSGTASVWSDYNVVWYDNPNPAGGPWLALGDTFYTTPVLFDTTSYWAVATSSSQGNFTLGAGAGTISGTACNPFGQYYTSNNSQFIITAAELLAAGIMPGNINSLQLNCITPPPPTSQGNNLNGFSVKIGHTSQSVMSSGSSVPQSAMTQVYTIPTMAAATGWNMFDFTNPWVWNGVDNVVVEFCFSNGTSNWSSNGVLAGDNVGFTCGLGVYTDGTFSCGNNWTLYNYTTAIRPQMILNATVPGCESNMVEVVVEVTNIPDWDAGVVAINSPVSGVELTTEIVCVDLVNYGANAITGFPVVYEVTGAANTLVTEIFTGIINPGDMVTYCFAVPVDLSVFDTYSLCVYTSLTNDGYAANDTLCSTIINEPLQYCVSNATSTGYEEIVEVSLGSFTNNSGPAFGSTYQDFTSLSTLVMSPGMTYPISITSDFPPGYSYAYTCYVEVYIDWNHDGVYDQSGDELVYGALTNSSNTVSGTITVPFLALAGNHGMRVVMEETSSGANVNPCGTYTWGETEDYIVGVVEPQAWDAAVTTLLQPSMTATLYENDPMNIEVIFFNVGLNTMTAADVVYTINGLNPVVFPWTGSLASFGSDTVLFPSVLTPGGYFDLCAYTILQGDTNYINDTLCHQYFALPQFDLEMTSLIAPESGCDYTLVDVTVEITNLGDTVNGGVDVSFMHSGMATAVTETITDTIPQGGVYTYTFTAQADLTVTVDTDFDFYAYLAYGPDPVQLNDTTMEVVGSYVSPDPPVANGVTIWSSEIATLTITNPDTTQFYNWFLAADTSLMTTNDTLITPQLFDTTTYLVEASAGGGSGSLTTTYASNNGQAGNMVDVTALTGNITIESFDVNIDGSATMEVWYKQGSYIGFETNAGAWTLLGSANIVSNGANVPTPCPIGGLTIPYGEMYALYITTTGGSINYTTLSSPPYHTDGNLLIDNSCGKSYPFGSTFTPRDWNGTIYYSSGNGCTSAFVPVTVAVQYADYDGGVVDIVSPVTGPYQTTEDVTCILYNNGLNAISGFPVYYELNGLPPVSELFTGTILPGDSATFTFTVQADISVYGWHTLCVGCQVPNDGYALNDELCSDFQNQNGTGLYCTESFPYIIINDPTQLSATTFAYDSEWWKFVVPVAHDNVVVSLCGSSFDTQLQIWDSCAATSYSHFNDDFCGAASQITMNNGGIVAAGTYYVRVYGWSDAFGNFSLSITGDQVPKFEIIETLFDVECNGASTGSASIVLGPGQGSTVATLPVVYEWYDAGGTYLGFLNNISGLPAGDYTISVTDNDGWMETETYTITEPTAIVITGAATDATTYGANDGTIDISVSGGTPPYTYAWPLGETTEDLAACYAGVYVVSVTDGNGCIMEGSFSVASPMPTPVWNVIPTNVSHNINVPMNALVTLDGILVDPGSLIGVFYDSAGTKVCGGYAFFTPGLDATVTAYGLDPGMDNGFVPGESFFWKVWDAAETDAYAGVAAYNTIIYPNAGDFAIGGLSGVTEIEAFSIITQLINLPAGWSIWSTYIDPLDPNISLVMADIVSPPFTPGAVEIVKNGNGQIFWPFYGLNTIGNVVMGEGYQVKINGTSPVVFGVTGLQLIPEISMFNIPNGWSIMGYLRTAGADISLMLAPIVSPPFTPSILEIAKNGNGQIFWPFYGLNTIGNMMPGEGYQVKLNSAYANFFFPPNTAASTKSNGFTMVPENYGFVAPTGDNMTVGIPMDAWSVKPVFGDEIAVFNSSDELIGTAVYEDDFTAISVWGKEIIEETEKGSNGQIFSMTLWQSTTGIEQSIIVEAWERGSDEYVTNGISVVGKLSLEGENDAFVLGQNMPNPFNGTTRIPFYLPEDAYVTISIYNALGELVEELISESRLAGAHTVDFDGSGLEAGNYFYKLISDKYVATKPMTLK